MALQLRAAYLGRCQVFTDHCTFSLAPECSSLSHASPITHAAVRCGGSIHTHGLKRLIQRHAERFCQFPATPQSLLDIAQGLPELWIIPDITFSAFLHRITNDRQRIAHSSVVSRVSDQSPPNATCASFFFRSAMRTYREHGSTRVNGVRHVSRSIPRHELVLRQR